MKEFTKAIIVVLIGQLLSWGLFILCDESKLMEQGTAENTALLVSLLFSIALIIIYFIYSKKFIKKYELNSVKFNSFLFSFWIILSYIIMNFMFIQIDKGYLHVCKDDCFLNGIEYGANGLFMVSSAIIILLIKLLILIINKLKEDK